MKNKAVILLVILHFSGVFCVAQYYPNKTFDWEKTHADRFVNSPCYKTLGFSPDEDPAEQEEKYKRCEEEERNEKIKLYSQIGFGILLVAGFCGAIIYGINNPFTDKSNKIKPSIQVKPKEEVSINWIDIPEENKIVEVKQDAQTFSISNQLSDGNRTDEEVSDILKSPPSNNNEIRTALVFIGVMILVIALAYLYGTNSEGTGGSSTSAPIVDSTKTDSSKVMVDTSKTFNQKQDSILARNTWDTTKAFSVDSVSGGLPNISKNKDNLLTSKTIYSADNHYSFDIPTNLESIPISEGIIEFNFGISEKFNVYSVVKEKPYRGDIIKDMINKSSSEDEKMFREHGYNITILKSYLTHINNRLTFLRLSTSKVNGIIIYTEEIDQERNNKLITLTMTCPYNLKKEFDSYFSMIENSLN